MHNFRNTCTNANSSFRTCPSRRPISSGHYSEHDDVELHGVVRRETALQMAVGRQRGALARSLMRWPFVSTEKVGEARTRSAWDYRAHVQLPGMAIVFASGCCACRSLRRCRLSDMKTKRVPALPFVYHIFAAGSLHRVAGHGDGVRRHPTAHL